MAHSSCSANGSLSVSCLWEEGGRVDPRGSSQGGKGLGAAASDGDSAGGGAAGSLRQVVPAFPVLLGTPSGGCSAPVPRQG